MHMPAFTSWLFVLWQFLPPGKEFQTFLFSCSYRLTEIPCLRSVFVREPSLKFIPLPRRLRRDFFNYSAFLNMTYIVIYRSFLRVVPVLDICRTELPRELPLRVFLVIRVHENSIFFQLIRRNIV